MSEARRGRRMPFVILPWAVLVHELLTAHDVLVYATIARYAVVTTCVAWPSRQTVAQNARCDIKTVDRSVTRLVAAYEAVVLRARDEWAEPAPVDNGIPYEDDLLERMSDLYGIPKPKPRR